jgi:hypothetical protein
MILKKGVFYSDNIDDINQNIIDAFNVVNKRIAKKPYRLDFTAHKVEPFDSFHALNKSKSSRRKKNCKY